jgi:hypothetical protein
MSWGVCSTCGWERCKDELNEINELAQAIRRGCISQVLTKGGDKYSIPTLFARRLAFSRSFVKLYLSIRKLSVGPFDSFTILRDGAMGVIVNASKWVTPNVGARTRKSFNLFRLRSCEECQSSKKMEYKLYSP